MANSLTSLLMTDEC